MQFHARYFRQCPTDWTSVPQGEGLPIQRETTITLSQGSKGFKIRESRMATCIMSGADRRSFSITTLRDHKSGKLDDLRTPNARRGAWRSMQVEDCEDFQFVAIFQAEINCLLHESHQVWTSTLSHVDDVVVYTCFQSGNGIHSIANAKVVV
jgi:hypothetical protein